MRLIHCGNVDMCSVYEPILGDETEAEFRSSLITTTTKSSTYVCDHDSGDRTQEDGVTTHESQEACRTVQ